MTNYTPFPLEMINANRWGNWFFDQRDGNLTKRPWDAVLNRDGKVNDPYTWTNYQTATNYRERYRGIAFYCGDGWCLLDLDHIQQLISDYLQGQENLIGDVFRILGNTYCEVSTSGAGLHFIFKVDETVTNFGQKKRDSNATDKREDQRVKTGHELYHDKRFIALTGNCFNGSYQITTINQEKWARLYTLVFNEPLGRPSQNGKNRADTLRIDHRYTTQLSVEAQLAIKRILHSSDGLQFKNWLYGNFWDSSAEARAHGVMNFDHSSVDLKCCRVLAYHTFCDPQLVDEIFRHTGLYRPKWDEYRGSQLYGDKTITKAIEDKAKYFATA